MRNDPPAVRFLAGDSDAALLADLRASILRWAEQQDDRPLPLNRLLGLRSPRATRQALRDALLADAAALLDGTRWSRCKQIAELARAFNARRFSVWSRAGVPESASAVDRLLYRAREQGEPLPETPEQYLNILPPPV